MFNWLTGLLKISYFFHNIYHTKLKIQINVSAVNIISLLAIVATEVALNIVMAISLSVPF